MSDDLDMSALADVGVTTEEAIAALQPLAEAAARVWEEQRPLRETLAAAHMAEWRRRPWRFDLYRRARLLTS